MYEKYIVVSTAECESSVYSGNRLSGCPDSFTVWRAGGTLETSLLLCAVCFSLHLFWLHSTWIIMHYPPVCTPAQVIREYMSGEEKRRQGFNYYCNYCTSGVTNWSISYGKCKEKIKEGKKGLKETWTNWRFSHCTTFPSILGEGWKEETSSWGIECFLIPGCAAWRIDN